MLRKTLPLFIAATLFSVCNFSQNSSVCQVIPHPKMPACFGDSSGSIALEITDAVPPIQVLWSNGEASSEIQNLPAGNFSATVSDAAGCSQTVFVSLVSPEKISLSQTQTQPVSCIGLLDGGISIQVSGGVFPYKFQWSNNQNGPSLAGVPAGKYSVTITDSVLCEMREEFTVEQPQAIFAGATLSADTCEASTGAINLTTLGGTPPYQIQWSTGQTNAQIGQLPAGNYSVTVSDAHGCTVSLAQTVEKLGSPPDIVFQNLHLDCRNPSTALNIANPSLSTTYLWVSPSGKAIEGLAQPVSEPGIYSLTATSSPGNCTAVGQIEITADFEKPKIWVAENKISLPCGQNSVWLDATASETGSNFSHHWSGNFGQNQTFADSACLALEVFVAGNFTFKTTNNTNGCESLDSVFVKFATPISEVELEIFEPTCFGKKDGEIHLKNVLGGKAPFAYSIDNQGFVLDSSFKNLPSGEYFLEISDSQKCLWQGQVPIGQPDSFAVKIEASNLVLKKGESAYLMAAPSDFGRKITAIDWQPSVFFPSPENLEQEISPEKTVEIEVRVADENGCLASDKIEIRVPEIGVFIPNVFQPSSRANSHFTVFGGPDVQIVRSLRVFDRWGGLVFENQDFAPNDERAGWDGQFNGRPLPPGAFVFIAEIEFWDDRVEVFSGSVLLSGR